MQGIALQAAQSAFPAPFLLSNSLDLSYSVAVDYSKIITVEPGKRSGKPCIRGLRITVYDVLDYLASGMTQEQVLKDFPYLTVEDIRACLAFAADRERKTVFVAGEAPVG